MEIVGRLQKVKSHFHRLVKHIQELMHKVISIVPKQGITAWEMSRRLFPRVDHINRFLAVSEAVANLDLAVAEGKLRLEQGAADVYLRS